MTEWLTLTELSSRLKLSTKQLRTLRDAGLPCRVRKGKVSYQWPQANHWYIAYKVERAVARMAPADIDDARARKLTAEAALAELELAEMRGDLIRLDDAMVSAGNVFDRIRARLLAVPTKEAHRLVGLKTMPKFVAELRSIMDAVLTELSDGEQ